MISFQVSGDFKKTEAFLTQISKGNIFGVLEHYGQLGVTALAAGTPVKTGLTAASWTFEIEHDATSHTIIWSNTNVVSGKPIAVLLQYGHGTGSGGYVLGRDYINPTLRPIFDKIADEVWKEVTSA